MTPKIDLVNVKVSVNGKEQVIKMERGTSFENKGGIFTAGETNGILKMTNYQLKTFQAMANNYVEEGENEIVLSKKDIQEAQNKYRNGEFVTDMSEFLPEGYKIERPKLTSAENMVQAYVTNGKESQSATLKFSIVDTINNLVNKDNKTNAISNKNKDVASLVNKEITYKEWGNTSTIKYNNDGKPITFRTTSLQPDANFIYDKNGRLTKIEYPTRENCSKTFTYHPNGKIAQETVKGVSKGEPYAHIFTYSPTGKIAKIEETKLHDDAMQKGHAIHTYSYDSNGKLKYVVTATNMSAAHESITNYEVYPRYTIVKSEPKPYGDDFDSSTVKVLGFSDSADYKKSGLQTSYYDTALSREITVNDDYLDPSHCYFKQSRSPELYPWGNSLSPNE